MDVMGNLDFKGLGKLKRAGLAASDFPTNPTEGEFLFKDGRVYVCAKVVDDLPFWVPLTQQMNTVRYDQQTPALEWTIQHNLGTNMPIVQVYDAEGLMIIPEDIDCSSVDTTLIVFGTPTAGSAILLYGDSVGLPANEVAYTETFSASTTWVVNHGLGYNPSVTCIVANLVVQPQSIVHNSTMQTTITFSTAQAGLVRCV